VAASEDEAQAVVFDRVGVGRSLGRKRFDLLFIENIKPCLAADAVDRLEAARRDQPGARIGRNALARPLLQGGAESLVQRLFGEVEVADQPHERGEDAARFRAVQPVERFSRYLVGAFQGCGGATGFGGCLVFFFSRLPRCSRLAMGLSVDALVSA
jgi:hypothetical protein